MSGTEYAYEVGKIYLVPTVRYSWHGRMSDWPVFGPLHSDAEFFDFPWKHYHVDIRFLSDAELRIIGRKFAPEPDALFYGIARAYGAPLASRDKAEHPQPGVRRRKCHRQWDYYPHGDKAAVIALRAAFSDKQLIQKDGDLLCPHRGVSLATIPPDENGVITCPLHGLKWCAKSGEAR
jgi:hypothetical protein